MLLLSIVDTLQVASQTPLLIRLAQANPAPTQHCPALPCPAQPNSKQPTEVQLDQSRNNVLHTTWANFCRESILLYL